MRVYTVYEPGRPAKSLEERANETVFIKEGFTWGGFLSGPFWLAFNALWFEFAFALLIWTAVAGALTAAGLKDEAAGIGYLLLMLIIGFEGNSLWQWRLERKGYSFIAPVAGNSFEECEHRFFNLWLPALAASNVKPAPKPAADSGPGAWGDWTGPDAVGTLPGGA